MLDGWYCRSIANEQAAAEEQERALEESKLKKQYKGLKTILKNLLYENEAFKRSLRTAQKRLLTVTRDRSFLLERILLYEKQEHTTSESEETESSDEESTSAKVDIKRRKLEGTGTNVYVNTPIAGKSATVSRKRRPPPMRQVKTQLTHNLLQNESIASSSNATLSDGHMTPEEIERHLQSRQSFLELERAPLTVPTEMFSNEPSLDSESNDLGELETSPSNMGEELSIDMIVE